MEVGHKKNTKFSRVVCMDYFAWKDGDMLPKKISVCKIMLIYLKDNVFKFSKLATVFLISQVTQF